MVKYNLTDDKKFTKSILIENLNNKNINVRPTWKPIHKLHYLKNFHRDDLSTNYLYKLFNYQVSKYDFMKKKIT